MDDSGPLTSSLDAAQVALAEEIGRNGYVVVPGAEMVRLLSGAARAAWPAYAASWDDLGDDNYMADGGRYRSRRHAVFELTTDAAMRKPHQPHYQSRDYNRLNGGVQRWFEPVLPAAAESAVTGDLLALCGSVFGRLETPPRASRHVEMHQFRIEPAADGEGQPTPEGVHRDGVEWVLVMLVGRRNVERGVTTVHAPDGRGLGAFTLQQPLDAVLLDDRRVAHGVTPISRIDPTQPGCRDVLVLTFDKP
ncbi:MAG TPA: 2OG-Fe dioxygenase family protein [Caulobacteraceae bacterium]|jgi:hypothetical protein